MKEDAFMKNTLKRIFALLLTLCMMTMPMLALADAEPRRPDTDRRA